MAELGRLAPKRVVTAGFEERVIQRSLADFNFDLVPVDEQATYSPQGGTYNRLWLVDDSSPITTLAALGDQIGARLMVVEGDMRALPPETREMINRAVQVEMLSELGNEVAWQLAVVRRGVEIPGGGLLMFDAGFNRRLVALYGHPAGSALGVLGEQGPEEGVERLQSIAEGYDADGSVVVPTFEIIATIASASVPEATGTIRLMTARGCDQAVDRDRGRQRHLCGAGPPVGAKRLSCRRRRYYEEFLLLPHVGLALDPEWRLKPHRGTPTARSAAVDAARRLTRWWNGWPGMVREHALPQKLLIVHQFQLLHDHQPRG